MLTVLIRYVKTRREVLTPATSVEYQPTEIDAVEPGLLILNGDKGQHLVPTEKGDENWRYVFVMNENGSTVARYTL